MNVSLSTSRHTSLAIDRIAQALYKFSPPAITWTGIDDADLIIYPVTGRRDHVEYSTSAVLRSGTRYAILQLSLKSTRNPNPADWLGIWQGAALVWSYYYLPGKFNFYHAPLGADPALFHRTNTGAREYIVGTTGQYNRTECLWEVEKGARLVGKRLLKIRAKDDAELNQQYNQIHYINALRTKEGFELPAAEAMLAGARPIMFDLACYRYWYDGIAEFIPPCHKLALVDRLVHYFLGDPKPVSNMEISAAAFRFDWHRIISKFWDNLL